MGHMKYNRWLPYVAMTVLLGLGLGIGLTLNQDAQRLVNNEVRARQLDNAKAILDACERQQDNRRGIRAVTEALHNLLNLGNAVGPQTPEAIALRQQAIDILPVEPPAVSCDKEQQTVNRLMSG
jgi:hypothetical protein